MTTYAMLQLVWAAAGLALVALASGRHPAEPVTVGPPAAKPKCGTCLFFVAGPPSGTCHRRSPVAGGFPPADAREWCGEWAGSRRPAIRRGAA